MAQLGIGIIIAGGSSTPAELDEVAIFQNYQIAEFQNKNLKNKNNKTNVYQAPESVIQIEQVIREGV